MNILLSVGIIAAICAVIYLLYCGGFAVWRRTAAILFVFRHSKTADKATMDSCTGWVKHVGKFHESKTYEFILDAQLSKGNAKVILLNREKQQLMKLNPHSPACKIELDAGSRYYLRWEFEGATGKCELRW